MAKLKMLKRPKSPKASSSNAVKEAFLKKLAAVKKENQRRQAANRKGEELSRKIAKAIQGF